MSAILFTAVRAFAGVEPIPEVIVATTGSEPASPVILYTDASGTTEMGNPVSPDSDGSLSFYVETGTVMVDLVYGSGFTSHRVTVPV